MTQNIIQILKEIFEERSQILVAIIPKVSVMMSGLHLKQTEKKLTSE